MAKGRDKNQDGEKGKKGKALPRRDVALWKVMTRDVRRLPGRDYLEEDDSGGGEKREPVPGEVTSVISSKDQKNKDKISSKPDIPTSRDVDARTLQRFKRGQMDIEGMIDLHGFGQAEAHEALRRFIVASQAQGRRCVLVITGKGHAGKPGVLRARVPEWLAEMIGPVLKIAPAKPNHGGHGAFYVLIRRKR